MVGLYQDPQGKKVFSMTQSVREPSHEDGTCDILRQRIKELEAKLESWVCCVFILSVMDHSSLTHTQQITA